MLKTYGGLSWSLASVLVCFVAYNNAGVHFPIYMRRVQEAVEQFLEAKTTEALQGALNAANITFDNLTIIEVDLTVKEILVEIGNERNKRSQDVSVTDRIAKQLEIEFIVSLQKSTDVTPAGAKVITIEKSIKFTEAYDALVRVVLTGLNNTTLIEVLKNSLKHVTVYKMDLRDVPLEPGFERQVLKQNCLNNTKIPKQCNKYMEIDAKKANCNQKKQTAIKRNTRVCKETNVHAKKPTCPSKKYTCTSKKQTCTSKKQTCTSKKQTSV